VLTKQARRREVGSRRQICSNTPRFTPCHSPKAQIHGGASKCFHTSLYGKAVGRLGKRFRHSFSHAFVPTSNTQRSFLNSARDGVEEPYAYDYMGLMSLFFASVGFVTKLRICVWLSVFALASAAVNVRRSSLDSRTLMGAGMVLMFAFYTVYIQNHNSGESSPPSP
jgi:hypothetical protein